MALSDQPAQRHREIGRVFTNKVNGTDSWDVPAPVPDWTARDVVRHLVEWLPAFLGARSSPPASNPDLRAPSLLTELVSGTPSGRHSPQP